VCRWVRPQADEQPLHLWMSLTTRGLVREDQVLPSDVVKILRATPAYNPDGTQVVNPRAGWKPPPRLGVWGMGALEGAFAKTISFDEMVLHGATTFRANHVHDVFGDSYMAYALEPAFQKHGLRYRPLVWSHESKSRAVLRLRQYFRD